MTIQETIKQLKYQRAMFNFDPMTGEVGLKDKESREGHEACTMAIRSLEAWEKVLDGIGNYIENKSESGVPREIGMRDGAIDCYDFINKHLSEVEDGNADSD